MERLRASPFTMAFALHGMSGHRFPSIKAQSGGLGKFKTARRMAIIVACKILTRSISSGSAIPTPIAACAKISFSNSSRLISDNFLLSLRPSGILFGTNITAAATTGPANGPRPASSTPQTRPLYWRSNEKSGALCEKLEMARILHFLCDYVFLGQLRSDKRAF